MEFAQKVAMDLTRNMKKKLEICKFDVSRFTFQDVICKKKKSFMYMSYLHYQHKHLFKAKLTWDFIAFTCK